MCFWMTYLILPSCQGRVMRMHPIYIISILYWWWIGTLCPFCCLYSSTLERMLVRCSTWSRDGYRCLCACSLRPCVSALPSLPSVWNGKWMIFYQFIITRSEKGVAPIVGVNLGYMETPNRRTLIWKFTTITVVCLWSVHWCILVLFALHIWDTYDWDSIQWI